MTAVAPVVTAPRNGSRRLLSSDLLAWLVAAVVLSVAVRFLFTSTLTFTLLTQALIDAIFATSVGFLARQNGRISFGQAAFFGLGGYAFALVIHHGAGGGELAVLVALLLPPLVAFLLGLVISRIPGVAFAMLTLAVGQAFYEIVFKWRALAKGDDGMSFALPPALFGVDTRLLQSPKVMVIVAWVVLVLILLGITLFARGRYGRLTEAIRDNDERARFLGYGTTVPRAAVYALSAFIAGTAGILQAIYNAYISPQMLHWSLSGLALIMAIVGGVRMLWGPAIGALLFFFLKDAAGNATEYWPAIVGGVLIVVTLVLPDGVSGLMMRMLRRFRRARAT